MARYEDVLVGGEGLRDDIQDLWSKLVERSGSPASSSASTRCALVAERVFIDRVDKLRWRRRRHLQRLCHGDEPPKKHSMQSVCWRCSERSARRKLAAGVTSSPHVGSRATTIILCPTNSAMAAATRRSCRLAHAKWSVLTTASSTDGTIRTRRCATGLSTASASAGGRGSDEPVLQGGSSHVPGRVPWQCVRAAQGARRNLSASSTSVVATLARRAAIGVTAAAQQ